MLAVRVSEVPAGWMGVWDFGGSGAGTPNHHGYSWELRRASLSGE